MWGDTVTLTSAQIKAGSGSTSYGAASATDGDGNTWNAYAIKNQHSNATSDYHFWQIKKYASSTAYYVQVPTLGTKITQLVITVSSSSKARDGGGNTATLYFSNSNSTSDTGKGVVSGTGASSVTIDCSSLDLNSGYITASGAVRIWDVEVTYTTGGGGGSSDPSISLGTYSVNATEAAVSTTTINVTYNNLTNYDADVIFYESDGTTAATYDHSWITAEINSSTKNLDYSITANTGAARTAYLKVYALGDEGEAESSLITVTQAAKTVNPPTFNLSTGTFLEGTGITLSTDTEGNTIRYNITTNGTEPSTPTKTTGTLYESPIILSGNCTTKIKAIAVDAYGNVSNATTRSYTVVAPTPTDLPFNWAGGGKNDFTALACVYTGGLGGDYGTEDHSPYLIKFDDNNDYIMIFTNSQPGKISIGVKMIGGATTSTIKVQEGTTGTGVFTDVESLTISGKQNAILNLSTTNAFATTTRVVKLLFEKGSNVGVGPISIALPEPAAPVVDDVNHTVTLTTTENMAGWRTYDNNTTKKYTVDGTTKVFYASAAGENKVTLSEIEGGVPANTTVILHQTSGTSITLTETDNAITAPASNMLAVSTANQNLGTVYRLGYKSTNGVGFYTYTSASAPAGIIYIATVNSARDFLGFAFEDEDVTAIESVKAQKVGGQYFNLAGQRVAQPTRGLYIVNGKKVVIK